MDQWLENIRSMGWALPAIGTGAVAFVCCIAGWFLLRGRPASPADIDSGLDDALAAAASATAVLKIRGAGIGVDSISPSIETITGYRAQALSEGDAFVRMIHDQDAAAFEQRIASAIQDERPAVTEFRYEDADGRVRWMQLRGTPLRDGRGRINKMRAVLRETTEARQLSAEMTAISARFHALADATPAMLWVLDENGAVTAVNRATERFCAVSEAALLGDGWLLAMPDEEQDGVRQYIARVIDHGTSLQREVVMIDPDNRERVIAMTATAAKNEEGAVTSVVLTGRDITDRSEGEKQRERMTRLIESSESPALIIAPDMRVAMLNPVARERAGLGERESADSIALWHVVTQETVEQIRSEGIRVCGDGGLYRCRGRVRDGKDSSLAAEFTLVGLGDGWLGLTAREIEHEIKRANEAKLDKRRLEVILRALGRLSGGGWAPGRAAERICESIADAYPGVRAAFHTLDDSGTLLCVASDEPAWMGHAEGRTLRLEQDGSLISGLSKDEPVIIADAWAEPELDRCVLLLEEHAARSLVMLGVDTGDRSRGVMTLEHAETHGWSSDEIEALQLAARLLGLAMRAERERRARIAAETRAAEQTQRWREERERNEELSRLASDRVTETERLAHRLAKSDSVWSAALARLGSRASAARELADEARTAGLNTLAERLSGLAHEADRAEIAGRIVSGTVDRTPEVCTPREIIQRIGVRLAAEAKNRGASLRVSQHGSIPESLSTNPRLFRVACTELLSLAIERCGTREVKAVASSAESATGPRFSLKVTGGPVLVPTEPVAIGVPTGVALLRQVTEALGGELAIEQHTDSTTMTLTVPLASDAPAIDLPEMPGSPEGAGPGAFDEAA